jgi:hypothetical protein
MAAAKPRPVYDYVKAAAWNTNEATVRRILRTLVREAVALAVGPHKATMDAIAKRLVP